MHVVPSDTADFPIVTRALRFVGTVHVTMISGKTAVICAPEMETFLDGTDATPIVALW